MDLFKERLKIAWVDIKVWLVFGVLPMAVIILISWLISLSDSLGYLLLWATFYLLFITLLYMIFHRIYWLFVWLFRKKKEADL